MWLIGGNFVHAVSLDFQNAVGSDRWLGGMVWMHLELRRAGGAWIYFDQKWGKQQYTRDLPKR